MASLQRLRVATFNVHGFANGNSVNTFDEICELLCAADLDVIGLQEASRALLPELVRKLGEGKYQQVARYGGTAILTRLPVVSGSNAKPGKGRYCCCELQLPFDRTGQRPIRVVVVHLDHRKESTRMNEMKTIVGELGARGSDIWLGDFNSLTQSDYTKQEWNEIAAVRHRNNWELPVSDLTSFVTAPLKVKGTQCKGMGLCDAFELASDANRSGPLGTSRFNTRIDYIFYGAQYFKDAGWSIVTCEHLDCRKYSDHNLVVATFMKEE